MSYKNILIGINTMFPNWLNVLTKLNKENIIIIDFEDNNIQNLIIEKKIDFILPLSEKDFIQIKKYNEYKNIILFPNIETINILHNKILFIQFMLENFHDYIPTTYYLDNKKLFDIEYPVISKPIYSVNGTSMKIFHNEKDFLECENKLIIQKFIEDLLEFGAFILCINGKIINWKIIKFKYERFTIKKNNFPNNYENVDDIDITIFEPIINKLNYTGGINFDFKFNFTTKKIDIFEINPRFGGSAFSLGFIYDLLCIKV
jgi:carbamoylphosphate synthase large subunit